MAKQKLKKTNTKGRKFTMAELQQIVDKPEDIALMELIQVYVPDSFVLIVSPTDEVVAAHKLKVINMKITDNDGKKKNIIKGLMNITEDKAEEGNVSKKDETTLNEFFMFLFKIILSLSSNLKEVAKENKKVKKVIKK